MTHYRYRYRRRPGPIAALFWLMIAVVALIALAEVNPPVTAPLAILLVVAIIWAAVRQAKAKQRAAVVRARPKSSIERVTVARQAEDCSRCGAPVQPKATRCEFCGNAYWRGGIRRTTERLS